MVRFCDLRSDSIDIFRFIVAFSLALTLQAQIISSAHSESPFQNLSETVPTLVIKQFEEMSYYLADIVLIDENVGWAVGEPHWNQTRKEYAGTIIKTADGGETWTTQDAGLSEAFNAVCFPDKNHGWVVGDNGVILHTSDGGQLWNRQVVATEDELHGVTFIDTEMGWTTGFSPVHYSEFHEEYDNWQASIWHTTDGGQTWAQQNVPEDTSILNDIQFLDAQTGWAVGSKLIGEKHGRFIHAGVVYHTSDGGNTWQQMFSPDEEFTGPTRPDIQFSAVDFVDHANGWVVGIALGSLNSGEGLAFQTTDGGKSWKRHDLGFRYDPLHDVRFIDAQRGFIVSGTLGPRGARVHRTVDGGTTWEGVVFRRTGAENDPLRGVAVAGDRVIAVGDHDYLVKSDRAWDSCEPAGPGQGPCESIFKQTFINTHYKWHDVTFVDEQNGWVVGSRSYEPHRSGQVILHTSDGGFTWETQYEDPPLPDGGQTYYRLDSVHFADAQNGWAVGDFQDRREAGPDRFWGAILHTADGGKTWEQQGQELYEGKGHEFYAVYFLDQQNDWALASRRSGSQTLFLAHTTNGGKQWNWVDTGIEDVIAIGSALVQGDVKFTAPQHGWAAGGTGTIIHTADGGTTWEKQELTCAWSSCPKRLLALTAVNDQIAWISGEGLYYTTNGGFPWAQQLDFEFDHDIHDIQFIDEKTGWLAGGAGAVMYTDDGGGNWHPVGAHEADYLLGLSFVNPQLGWAAGEFGVILKITADRFPPQEVEIQSGGLSRPGPAGPGGAPTGGGVMVIVQ